MNWTRRFLWSCCNLTDWPVSYCDSRSAVRRSSLPNSSWIAVRFDDNSAASFSARAQHLNISSRLDSSSLMDWRVAANVSWLLCSTRRLDCQLWLSRIFSALMAETSACADLIASLNSANSCSSSSNEASAWSRLHSVLSTSDSSSLITKS